LAGVRLLRFTASDVLHRPAGVVTQVRNALAQAPSKPAFHSPVRVSGRLQTRVGLSVADSEPEIIGPI
jgi:hypothetical protein